METMDVRMMQPVQTDRAAALFRKVSERNMTRTLMRMETNSAMTPRMRQLSPMLIG